MVYNYRADDEPVEGEKKVRVFKKFQYRGKDLETLLDMSLNHRFDELMALLPARARRRFIKRGISRKHKVIILYFLLSTLLLLL